MRYLLLLAILLLSSCTVTFFHFTDKATLQQHGYPDFPQTIGRYVLEPTEFENSNEELLKRAPFPTVLSLLKRGKLKRARLYLTEGSHEKGTDSYALSEVMMLFREAKYTECIEALNHLEKTYKNCYTALLRTDCEFAIDLLQRVSSFEKYLKKYQAVLDCNSTDKMFVSIIKTRLKLIRYNY